MNEDFTVLKPCGNPECDVCAAVKSGKAHSLPPLGEIIERVKAREANERRGEEPDARDPGDEDDGVTIDEKTGLCSLPPGECDICDAARAAQAVKDQPSKILPGLKPGEEIRLVSREVTEEAPLPYTVTEETMEETEHGLEYEEALARMSPEELDHEVADNVTSLLEVTTELLERARELRDGDDFEVAELREQVAGLQEELAGAQQQLNGLDDLDRPGLIAELIKRNTRQRNMIVSRNERIDELLAEKDGLGMNLLAHEQRIEDLEGGLEQRDMIIKDLEQDKAAVAQHYGPLIAELIKRNERQAGRIRVAHERVEELSDLLEHAKKEQDRWFHAHEEAVRARDNWKLAYDACEANRKALQARLVESEYPNAASIMPPEGLGGWGGSGPGHAVGGAGELNLLKKVKGHLDSLQTEPSVRDLGDPAFTPGKPL